MGLWIAYDHSMGIERFVFLCSGLVVMVTIIQSARQNTVEVIGVLSLICSLVAGFLALFYLVDADSFGDTGHGFVLLNGLYYQMKIVLPQLSLPGKFHSSAVAGALVILLPLGLLSIPWIRQFSYGRKLVVPVVGALLAGMFVLIIVAEQSAWIALATGIVVAGYFHWRFGPGQVVWWRWIGDIVLWLGLLAAAIAFVAILVQPGYRLPFDAISIGDAHISRGELWREALVMIEDYIFTGSGLGSTAMVFSTYLFLLHVPFLYHAYNLLLQITLEQGVPGSLAFTFMLIGSGYAVFVAYRSAYAQRQTLPGGAYMHYACTTTAAALIGLVVHGMVDAGLYTSTLVPIIFIPLAIAVSLTHGAPTAKRRGFHDQRAYQIVLSVTPYLVLGALISVPGTGAGLLANLGTLQQTKIELSHYHWPDWPIQDALRRDEHLNLEPARRYYLLALTKNPTNTTAHRRLGQIALSQGDYSLATQHLEMAHATSPEQRVTRQLLGEVYAAQGNLEEAVRMWRSVPAAFRQHLSIRQWWYSYLDAHPEADWVNQSVLAVNQSH